MSRTECTADMPGGGRKQGVTLIELLVAMAILGVVAAAVVAIWFSSERAFRTGDSIAQAQATARRAMATLENELRAASQESVKASVDRDGDGVPDPNAFAFSTYLPNATETTDVLYYLDDEARLIREAGGTSRAVATDVEAFDTSTATGQYAIVELTVSVRDLEASLRTQVEFRNP